MKETQQTSVKNQPGCDVIKFHSPIPTKNKKNNCNNINVTYMITGIIFTIVAIALVAASSSLLFIALPLFVGGLLAFLISLDDGPTNFSGTFQPELPFIAVV